MPVFLKTIYLIVFIALFFVPNEVLGQNEVIPDTLDWKEYYPLQIGNSWESLREILIAEQRLEYREIIGDTLIDERLYYIQTEVIDIYDPVQSRDNTFFNTSYLRYDTLGTRILSWSERNQRDEEYTPDLSADFGSETSGFMVLGGYNDENKVLGIGSDSLHFKAEKGFLNLGGIVTYFHGIGYLPGVGDGASGSSRLTYVRLDGVEYGDRVFRVSVQEESIASRNSLYIYPNPASAKITLRVNLSKTDNVIIEVYDMLGRSRVEQNVGTLALGEHEITLDTSRLVQGKYMVRVKIGGMPTSTPLTIVR